MSLTTTHTVSGVTSSHRVAAVSEELPPINEVRAAVDEAGHELADAGA